MPRSRENEREREIRGLRFRLRRHEPERKTLIIAVPTEVHEVLHGQLLTLIDRDIFTMELSDEWMPKDGVAFRAQPTGRPGGGGNGGSGEGDASGAPYPLRSGPGAWPTLVIDAGYS